MSWIPNIILSTLKHNQSPPEPKYVTPPIARGEEDMTDVRMAIREDG